MPGKSLFFVVLIVIILTGCATSRPRVILAPTEAPVQPTMMVESDYPAPNGNETISKSVPYPEQNAQPAIQPEYPLPQASASAGESPYPLPSVTQAPGASQPWEPQPGDDKLQRGNVYLDSQQILTLESFPPQFTLELKGNLPTPCSKLRVKLNMPDANQQIEVEVYSLADPTEICIQVLEAFQVSVPLKGLPSGTYQVLVNQQPVGEMTVP
jgi:hypothetical protein